MGGVVLSPREVWQCLERFLILMTGREGVRLASSGSASKHPTRHRTVALPLPTLPSKNYQDLQDG